MIRTVETLSKRMMEGEWNEMAIGAKLEAHETLTKEEVDRCISFLRSHDGHESLIKAFERCLE